MTQILDAHFILGFAFGVLATAIPITFALSASINSDMIMPMRKLPVEAQNNVVDLATGRPVSR